MWQYEITTGRVYSDKGDLIGVGYSGTPQYRNDALATNLKDLGPCPVGIYRMREPIDTVTHGPYVMWLDPDPNNEMFGRAGFGIHGDSVIHPGTASTGCIIQSRGVREHMWKSGDHDLNVVVSREGAALEGNTAPHP